MPDFHDALRQRGGSAAGLIEDGLELADGDAEKPRGDFKHAGHHAVHREIWAQRLLVEVVVLLALLFRPVGDFPRLERADGLAGFRGLVLGELFVLCQKRRMNAGVEILDKAESGAAVFRHAADEC